MSPLQGHTVEIAPVPAGVTVTPAEQPVDPDGGGVEVLELVVQRGATGRVWLRQLSTAGVATVITGGPRVVPGPKGWHFAADK